ncbi:MAG TPA: SH3 domain-containing protein [Sphingorhabdus sp.]|jgi:hypothetical protein|uniref:SH3 domain-containing protein n=1 Tax=Sphingorhabdus sp. TaxID=1902408 RepID=UPI002BC2EF27|nr:SH3 domain-containing protein [Sphingorhabdus sp.]HMT41853.1 SH3 domain-containing protein [Sphingorhabdus sp.]HMU21306.1 SH3 domain-containing protein [Sphingorhabdus sp.]
MRKLIGFAALIALSAGASAKDEEPALSLSKCETNYGTIAVVDGDTQGWTKFGLGSPRELVNAFALESGCFTPHNPASGEPANYLMNVIAGDKEEVDKSIDLAKAAVTEGLVRSGAVGGLVGGVPLAGPLLGMFGGLGGKKKTVAAGIRVVSPANGLTLVSGSGEVKKSALTFAGASAWESGVNAAGYGSSKDGKMLAEAFMKAFNAVSRQASILSQAAPSPKAGAGATAAVDTSMYAAANKESAVLRALRAGTSLNPTGNREGLFVEMTDNFGTRGWVSVEDLQ